MNLLRRPSRWLFSPLPESRLAVFAILVYAFVVLDVLVTSTNAEHRGALEGAWYQPLLIGELLPLPVPTEPVVLVCKWGSVLGALAMVVLTVWGRGGRWPPILGTAVFLLWFEYQIIGNSYGKVDHDRLAFLVALAVLPACGALRRRSTRLSEHAGFALRCVQLAVVATYFYAGCAKVRFGGWEWVNSAAVLRSVIRRGTWLAEPLLSVPQVLTAAQWGILAMEFGAPLIFLVSERARRWAAASFAAFHVMTYAMITIVFLPHLLCLSSFLPLERLLGQRFTEVEPSSRGGREQAGVPPGNRDRLAATQR